VCIYGVYDVCVAVDGAAAGCDAIFVVGVISV